MPFIAFFAFEIWEIQAAWVVVPLFYASIFSALRPVNKRLAPMSFWYVALGVGMTSGFGAMIALEIFRWMRSWFG